MNKFWEDMIPRWRDIKVPAYIAAGLCHPQHLRGTMEGWRRIRSRKKWIRIHREFEWPDTYTPENLLDLKRFYDRYMKDIRNGWELTPRVRLDVMDAYDYDYKVRRKEKEFPLKRTEYKKLYLNAEDETLNTENPAVKAEREYDPETDVLRFRYKFREETELIGYFMLHLNVEVRGYDNMDMHFWIKKYNAEGEFVPVTTLDVPYPGTYGYCRATRRELDDTYSTPFYPVPALKKYELMEEGQVYPVDISFNPHSRVWHKGEELVLEIAGHHMDGEFFPGFRPPFMDNEGTHVIHTGGEYESWLQVPFIPPKYKTGDYEYRD